MWLHREPRGSLPRAARQASVWSFGFEFLVFSLEARGQEESRQEEEEGGKPRERNWRLEAKRAVEWRERATVWSRNKTPSCEWSFWQQSLRLEQRAHLVGFILNAQKRVWPIEKSFAASKRLQLLKLVALAIPLRFCLLVRRLHTSDWPVRS